MKFSIKRLNGEVAFESDAETVAQAMELAVKRGAYLHGADLGGAYLHGAYLRGADLRGADLHGADLGGADLGGANLGGADLCGAYLCGAYLCGANLRGADGIISLGPCDGWWVYAVRHADGPRFAVGCQWFTLAEARAYWAGKENRAQVLRAVEWLATEAAARGWGAPKLDGGGE